MKLRNGKLEKYMAFVQFYLLETHRQIDKGDVRLGETSVSVAKPY